MAPTRWQVASVATSFVALAFSAGLAHSAPRMLAPSVPDATICDAAASIAASETDVPLSVLRAITRTETGRTRDGRFTPWPWTVNREGVGHWFDTRDAALAFAEKSVREGAYSFDVGCFQINYRWHGDAFSSVEQMFDPVENARYAADFLGRLFTETGNWTQAAGTYHSRTETFAKRYRARFTRMQTALDPMQAVQVYKGLLRRATPLFDATPIAQQTVGGSNGSLVMLNGGARPLLPGFGSNP